MAKYVTYNKYGKKKSQRTTKDRNLAIDRVEKGGYAVLKLSDREFIIKDKRNKK